MTKTTEYKTKTSRFLGVSKQNSSNKYVAQIKYNGHTKYLGLYNSEENAAKSYYRAILTYLGQGLLPNHKKWHAKIKWYQDNYPDLANDTDPIIETKKDYPHNEHPLILGTNVVATPKLKFQYTGVTWYSIRKEWRASVTYKKTKYFVGKYCSQREGIEAYNSKLDELYNYFKDEKLLEKKHILPSAALSNSYTPLFDIQVQEEDVNELPLLFSPSPSPLSLRLDTPPPSPLSLLRLDTPSLLF